MLTFRSHLSFAFLLPIVFSAVTCSESSSADVTVRSRAELQQAVQQATPGTRIQIAPGTYEGGLTFANLRGTEGQPIVLVALDKEEPPVFQGGGSGMHLTDPVYVELRDLKFRGARGNGLNIDDGGSFSSPAQHLVLDNLTIQDVGPQGNRDGIKLSGVDDFLVQHCTIERWGDAGGSAIDMVGCHNGKITDCTFRYRDDVGSSGVQAKGGSARITIQRCRFDHPGARAVNIGGSTGMAFFRPRPQGYEAKDITVADCTFIGSQAPIAFVGVDGAHVHHNTIYRPQRWVARILQETRGDDFVPSRDGRFTNNVIAFRSDELNTAVNIGSGTAPETFHFANNYWYCIDDPDRSDAIRLPVENEGSHYGIDPQFTDAEQGDLRLKSSSRVRNAGVRE